MAIQVGKYLKKTRFDLDPEDPYHFGVRIPKFSEAWWFGALYMPVSNSSASSLVQEILFASSKADLITLGRDLTELSTEDVELV